MSVAVAALLAGCTSDKPRPRTEPRHSSGPTRAPTATTEQPISGTELAKLAALLAKAEPVEQGNVGAKFWLDGVRYTSPTDAGAEFGHCRDKPNYRCTTIIATTGDNWEHAAGLSFPDSLADDVTYITLGRGAVAIKALKQWPGRRSYPPFVLYPDGKVKPLHIAAEPRPFDADSDILVDNYGDFYYEVGMVKGTWAVDVDAAQTYRLSDAPPTHVPRFDGKPRRRYADYRTEIGPGNARAEAMSDSPEDSPNGRALPLYLRELWLTDGEKPFRPVPLPWERLAFGGMAFASDGALLIAETKDPLAFCADHCHPGRIWRLSPGKATVAPLHGGPRLPPWSSVYWGSGLESSGGGTIIAYTGLRTIALSTDGYTWTKVTPGR